MRAFFTFPQQKTQVLANYEYAIERIDLDQEKQGRVKTCVKTALNNWFAIPVLPDRKNEKGCGIGKILQKLWLGYKGKGQSTDSYTD